ncbi:hypothetical protein ES288_A13G095800v1 [Gossypium darwinii]|uniref:Uncharacterized protein n=1 Tax=Gossypium darwinii TaxID=34276 RepID=A0A5D2DY15_GOSDA|nr:hypothetical protein ES288_A13G095800v1 [Gossypium darwinii]
MAGNQLAGINTIFQSFAYNLPHSPSSLLPIIWMGEGKALLFLITVIFLLHKLRHFLSVGLMQQPTSFDRASSPFDGVRFSFFVSLFYIGLGFGCYF